jgi:hypothetical protein
MKTSSYLRYGALSAAVLLIALAARSAGVGASSQKVSFAAAFQTEFTARMDSDYVAHINVVGDGAASLLGDATCETTNQIQYPNGSGSATYTLRSPRGSLTLECVGHPKPSDPATPDVLEVGGTYVVVAGTGMFHGAQGGGVFTVAAKFGNPPIQGTGRFSVFGNLKLNAAP